MARSKLWYSAASAFDPASLSPSLWLKGDGVFWQDSARTVAATADTNPVGSWDTSAGSNHAQQATAGKRPLLKTGANGLNGVPVVRFDGVDDFLSATITASVVHTIFIVVKKNSALTAASRAALSLATTPATQRYQLFTNSSTSTGYDFYSNAVGGTPALGGTPTAWNIISLTASSTSSLTIRVGGGAGTNLDPHDDYQGATALYIGDDIGADNHSDSDVAELYLVSSALSLANHTLVGNYLAAKYGLTWTAAA